MPIYRGKESEFSTPKGFAELLLDNHISLAVYQDELWEETSGRISRVNVALSISSVASQIDRMDDEQLRQFVSEITQDRGIHSGRLELTLDHGQVSSQEFAIKVLAHHFNVGAEVLSSLGERDIFTIMDSFPGNQGAGFRQRILREGRLQHVVSGDIPKGATVHLMSNGTLFQVMG